MRRWFSVFASSIGNNRSVILKCCGRAGTGQTAGQRSADYFSVILKCWEEGVQELQELQNGSAGYRLVEEVVKGTIVTIAFGYDGRRKRGGARKATKTDREESRTEATVGTEEGERGEKRVGE